jgi:hypothetical protein
MMRMTAAAAPTPALRERSGREDTSFVNTPVYCEEVKLFVALIVLLWVELMGRHLSLYRHASWAIVEGYHALLLLRFRQFGCTHGRLHASSA